MGRRRLEAVLLIAAAFVCSPALAGTARASEVALEAADVGLIRDPENPSDQRLLVRFPLTDALRSARIDLAVVECPVEVSCPDSVVGLVVDAFMVTSAWDGASVEWSSSWATPGGDIDTSQHATWTVACEDTAMVRFDITSLMRAWAAAERDDYGLMAAVAPGQTGTIGVASVEHGRRAPRMTVWYTPEERE